MPSLEDLTNQLKTAFDSKSYTKVSELITPIKLLLITNDLLIPNRQKLKDTNYINDLIISRSILEIGALSYINLKDFVKFQQIIDQLKVFYFNEFKIQELNKSIKKNKLLSLNLLYLLSSGDFVKFYTELEYYNFNLEINIENDLYLNYPIKLANWLIEGYYDKVLSSLFNDELEEKSKLKEFGVFNSILIRITRFEISKNLSKSYKSLKLTNAKTLLWLQNEKELNEFIEEFNWDVSHGEINFHNDKDLTELELEEEEIQLNNSERLVKNALTYAKEIDSII